MFEEDQNVSPTMLQYVVVEIIVVALAVGFTSLYCWLETTDIERFVVYLLGVVVVTLDLSIFVTMGMSIKWRNSISLLYISRALIIFNCQSPTERILSPLFAFYCFKLTAYFFNLRCDQRAQKQILLLKDNKKKGELVYKIKLECTESKKSALNVIFPIYGAGIVTQLSASQSPYESLLYLVVFVSIALITYFQLQLSYLTDFDQYQALLRNAHFNYYIYVVTIGIAILVFQMNKLTALRAIILYTIILFVTLRMFLGQRSRRYNKVDHYIYNLIKPFTAYEDNSKSANGPLELTSIDTFSRYLLFLGCLLSTVMTICYDTYLILFTLIFLVSEYPLSNDRMLPSPVNRIVTWITSHLINFQQNLIGFTLIITLLINCYKNSWSRIELTSHSNKSYVQLKEQYPLFVDCLYQQINNCSATSYLLHIATLFTICNISVCLRERPRRLTVICRCIVRYFYPIYPLLHVIKMQCISTRELLLLAAMTYCTAVCANSAQRKPKITKLD